jgi:hypothetical protein
MTQAAKERLAAAADSRKYVEREQRHEAFNSLTPRLLLKPYNFGRATAYSRGTDVPRLIRAGEIRFVPSQAVKSHSINLSGRGPFMGPERTTIEPDKIMVPSESMTATKSGGRILKPLAADLRKYDSIGARIAKLQTERKELLRAMVARARPLTADEVVSIGKTVRDISDKGYVRPESAAKKVRVPR